MVAPQNQGWGQPPQAGQPMQPGMAGPGQPAGPPSEIKLVGVLQLIAGILYLMTFLGILIGTLGFACLAITPIYGAVVAGMEIYNGARALGQNPDPGRFWWKTLPILGIVSIISGDFYSCVVGIIALVMLGKDEIQAWIR